jgi:multiple antibiotic resistance protein
VHASFAHDFVYEFVTLFVILDPVVTIPLFLLATSGLARKDALKVAAYAVGVAFLVLFAAIAGGQFLLTALHIPMAAKSTRNATPTA